MTPDDITIAVTVFDRRCYIEQAIASALSQTMPVRVIVVEDCGPDEGLQAFVLGKFGSRITYHRNPKRRGLFDNWNACIQICHTPWLCLLHDDDFLEPHFVETMVELSRKLPAKGLYYGLCRNVSSAGNEVWTPPLCDPEFYAMDLRSAGVMNPIAFPGEIFRTDSVKALGGFLPTSHFSGDWDMWLKLAVNYGAAGINRIIGNSREHFADGRATMRVMRDGKYYALIAMQIKKNLALLQRHGLQMSFDRRTHLAQSPIPLRLLLRTASGFSPRWLAYNSGLFIRSRSTTLLHFILQCLTRCFGPRVLGTSSRTYNLFGKVVD